MSIRILSLPFFCFLTVIQTAPPTWGVDIWEPNDSLADVQKLDIDTVHEIFTYASIDSPTDEDWFYLTHLAIADKWVTAWIEDRPGGQEGTGFDTVLEMLNGATGASIASNDDISSQIRQSGIIGAAVPMDASPTFRVRPFGADDLGPYRLYTMIHLQGGGRDRVEVEPNDTSGSSDGVSSGQNMSGVISDATDVDWLEFVTPLPHEAEFAVALRNDSGGGADFVVEVLDESGNVNYLPRLNDDGETGANDFLVFSVGDVQEKTRKIRVSSRSGTGAYRLFLGELNPSNQEWFRSPSLLNLSIPDNDISGVTDIITVPDSAVVENLNVRVNIEHSDLEDLRLELTHIDSGRTVTLYNANCPGATLTVSFDEESVFGFCPLAFGGHAPPVDSFAPFLDEDIKGDWALNVIDGDGGNTGTLRNWSFEMEASSKYVPPPFTCNSPYSGPMSGPISIKDSTGQGLAFTEDTIIISDPGTLADLNVFVDISHDDIADIGFTLENAESGLSVPLYTGLTCNETRVMAVFDDEGAAAPCPPVDPMTPIMPNASGAGLDAFEGRPLAGTWILRVNDANPGTTGTLNQWCLLPTLQTVTDTPTSTPTETPTPTTDVGFNCTSSYSGPMAGPATIPDATPLGVGTLQDTIVIADPGTLSDMDVFVDITHDAIADLGVSLVRQEDALVIPLYSGIACSATRLSAVFSDEGGAAPCPAIDPFTPIQPNTGTTSLDDLENRSLAGTWTLQVVDGSQGATGVLNSWCLIPTLQGPTDTPTFTPTETPTPTTDVGFNCNSPYSGPMAGPISIKDATGAGLARTRDSIVVTDMGTIKDVNVFVDITHDSVGELGVGLIHEEHGIQSPVYADALCSATRISAVIDDEGVVAPCPPIDPNTPILPPDITFPLSGFDNRELAGTWTLEITDGNQGNTGVLNQWCLLVTVESATGTATFTLTPTETPTLTPTGSISQTPTETPCSNSADLNNDGEIDSRDLVEFLHQLSGQSASSGHGSADLDCSQSLDQLDLILFQDKWDPGMAP